MRTTAPGAVLIVDDDRDVREAMVDVVESAGRQAFSAFSGPDALRKLDGAEIPRPCIILLDWTMAPMDGGEFLTHLQARSDALQLPVVIMTASDRGVALDQLGPPVVAVLRKPFEIDDLLTALDRIDGQR